MPFDFSNIQVSVWLAVIPVTAFLWKNFQMLKMDTLEEYKYLKGGNGVRILLAFRLGSYLMAFVYFAIVILNYEVFLGSKSKGNW